MFSSGKMIFSSHGVEFGTPPNPPRNLTGYGMVAAVRLGWSAPFGSFDGISYALQMKSGDGPWTDLPFSNLLSPEGGGAVNVEGLDTSLSYCFRVACSNRFGMSAWLTACVNPKVGPAAPPNVLAFRYRGWRSIGLFAPSRMFVDWDAPSSDMLIQGYIVEMKEANQNWGEQPSGGYSSAASVPGTLAEDILDRYAVEDSARLFRVKADTGGGYGPWSSPVSVQDGLGMSPGPVDWSAVGGEVTMFWEAPADTKGYTLSGYVVSIASPGLARIEHFVTGTSKAVTVLTSSSYTIQLRARYLNGPDVDSVPSSRYQVTLP